MSAVDPKLYAEALAELRALRPKQTNAEEPRPETSAKPKQTTAPARKRRPLTEICCEGDRAGYRAHLARSEEACLASKRANADYRKGVRPAAKPKEPAECPSYGAYLAHIKRGEDACDGCKDAKRAYDRERYAKNPRKARAPQRAYEARQRAARAA